MDIQELIAYVQELETENKELKKHIFNIQQQLDEKNESILLLTNKKDELAMHIQKCENEIIKRQQREVTLINTVDELTCEIAIYADEIARVKKDATRDKDKDKDREEVESESRAGSKVARMPPKSSQKCRNCEALASDREVLYVELQKERQKCYMLLRDIECMVGTFCTA